MTENTLHLSQMGFDERQIALAEYATRLVEILEEAGGELFDDDVLAILRTEFSLPLAEADYVIVYARAQLLVERDVVRHTVFTSGSKGALAILRTQSEIRAKRKQIESALESYRIADAVYRSYGIDDVDSRHAFWAGVGLRHELELLDWIEGAEQPNRGYEDGIPDFLHVDTADADPDVMSWEEFKAKYFPGR